MTTDTIRIILLAQSIQREFRDTRPGHCARVDFLERAEAEAVCQYLIAHQSAFLPRVLATVAQVATQPSYLTTDQAIELRNRKDQSLCLFVPTDLVDAAFSSLANSFALIDGRRLHQTVLDVLMGQFSGKVYQMVQAVFAQLYGVMRVGEEQRLDFACTVQELVERDHLHKAGLELWRVGLIADGAADFHTRLDRNRRCARSLKRPEKVQATPGERIQSIKVDGATAVALAMFFRGRDMFDSRAWSRALAEGKGLPFDRWVFPEEDPSDIRSVTIKSFIDNNGKVQKYCKLIQPDGPGGSLQAVYGEKKTLVVRWETDPPHPNNLDRWLVELVPSGLERTDVDVELSAREIAGQKRTLTLSLDVDFEDPPDFAVCVRVAPLDAAGGEIENSATGEPVAVQSQEFFLVPDDGTEPQNTRRDSRRTVNTLAFGRLEASLDEKGKSISESEPQWISKDLEYFTLKLNDRHTINIGLSSVLVELERKTIASPERGGCFVLNVGDTRQVRAEQCYERVPGTAHAAWESFWHSRRQVFDRVKKISGRDIFAAVPWDEPLANAVFKYARSYCELLDTLVENNASQAEILDALSVDTLLVRVNTGEATWEEAAVVLPTHPLRAAWIASYTQLLAHWEKHILSSSQQTRKQLLDVKAVELLTPTNIPAFVYHPEASQTLVFFENLRFYYGVALPANVPDPQRRIGDLAQMFAVTATEPQLGNLRPERLGEHIQRFLDVHPYTTTLVSLLINPDRGEYIAEALRQTLFPSAIDEDSQTRGMTTHLQVLSYVADERKNTVQALEKVHSARAERLNYGQTDHFLPVLTTTLRPMEALKNQSIPDAHIAVATDLTRPIIKTIADDDQIAVRSLSLYGLVNRFVASFATEGPHIRWWYRILPEGVGKLEPHPTSKRYTDDLVNLHTALLKAGGYVIDRAKLGHPALEVLIAPEQQQLLQALHTRANWVITLDRFFVLDYYDSPYVPDLGDVARKYLIDYAPEFAEGLGHRMMVTTAWRDEIRLLLAQAMQELGFAVIEDSISHLLHYLKTISGRLALQILESSTSAAAAVGLGVVTAWLQGNGRLRQAIMVPVDPHPRLFTRGVNAQPEMGEQRCDLLLVTLKRGIVEMTCVEVKWRRGKAPVDDLARDMLTQMESTARTIKQRFFDPNRLDGALQRAYLANILRFYLERAQRYNLIEQETAVSFLEHLGRMEKSELEFRHSYEGYIVSLDDEPRRPFPLGDAKMTLLTARDFEHHTNFTPLMPFDSDGAEEKPDINQREDTDIAPPEPVPESTHTERTSKESVTALPEQDATINEPDELVNNVSSSADILVPLGETGSMPIHWQPGVKGSPHLFIIGIPGQGKSWAVTRMLIELGRQHVPALVLDFHGQFAEPGGPFVNAMEPTVVDAARGLPFSPFEYAVEEGKKGWVSNSYAIAEIFAYVTGLGDMQRDLVFTAIRDSYKARGFDEDDPRTLDIPTLEEVLRRIEQGERANRTSNVTARCRPLLEMDLFQPDVRNTDLLSTIRSGLVIDLHNLYVETLQLAAGAFVLRKIYKDMFRWGTADRLRMVIVLDEAHRLAKDVTLPKIMKEGRKFGIAVIVASQGMSDFHQDILSNAGTKVVFRTNYPESRRIAGYIRSRSTQDLAERIEQLTIGSAYVQTAEMQYGSVVKMYPLE